MGRSLLILFVLVVVIVVVAGRNTSPSHSSGSVNSVLSSAAASDSVVGRPTISAAFIDQVLSAYHSPAAGTGQALYDDGVAFDIDPAFALAFFFHESSFGTQGEARSSLSLGNLRCIDGYLCRDGYAWFSSWEAGYRAWYTLIAGPLYVGAHLTTVNQIIPRYAPPADDNDDSAYCQAISSAISTWRSGQVQVNA